NLKVFIDGLSSQSKVVRETAAGVLKGALRSKVVADAELALVQGATEGLIDYVEQQFERNNRLSNPEFNMMGVLMNSIKVRSELPEALKSRVIDLDRKSRG